MVLPHASDRFYAQLLVDISDGLGRDDEVKAVLDEYADSTAEGEVVLDVFLNWKSLVSAALQSHPNFPREQLAARFADDPAQSISRQVGFAPAITRPGAGIRSR